MSPWIVIGVLVAMFAAGKTYGYIAGKPVEINLAPIGGGFYLEVSAAQDFLAMRSAAERDRVHLYVNSAFRSMAEQTRLYNLYEANKGNLAAKPGYSNHQSGIAIDIDVDRSFTSPTYRWLQANAHEFNFVNTGRNFSQPEPWHWEHYA